METRDPKLDLPPLELECMKAVWSLGCATVDDVRSRLALERPLAYTTVMTMLNRLARKGVVGREKQNKAHLYRPLITEAEARDRAIERLVATFFAGSRLRLVQYLQEGARNLIREGPEAEPRVLRPQRKEDLDPSLL